MKIVRSALLGIAPGVVGVIGSAFFPSLVGDVLMSVVYVLGVACCFWAGFGISDKCVRSPGKNLVLGFSLTALFFAINLTPLVAVTLLRSKKERFIPERAQYEDAERKHVPLLR